MISKRPRRWRSRTTVGVVAALIAVALLVAREPVSASGHTAARSLSAAQAAPGSEVTALFTLHDSRWVSYHLGAADLVNRSFRELFADDLPAITPLIAKREAAPAEQPANGR